VLGDSIERDSDSASHPGIEVMIDLASAKAISNSSSLPAIISQQHRHSETEEHRHGGKSQTGAAQFRYGSPEGVGVWVHANR
jgi:hypothetical protein